MIWQDLVIGGASVGFVIGIIEQIYEIIQSKNSSISLISSSIYSIGLYAMSFSMFNLGLTLSGMLTGINAIQWTIILILSYKYRFNKKVD